MNDAVSVWSIICMAVSALCAFSIPVVLCIYFRKKKQADLVPFFIGCAVMFLFALVAESLVHQLVLNVLPIGKTILNNIWLYALYGGLMAGLFEETGRLIAFKTVLRRYRSKDVNALMYGAGHGGFEAAFLLGGNMISYIIIAVLINAGLTSVLTNSLSAEQMPQMQAVFESLTQSAPIIFLLGIAERLFAVAMQISLSVIVWFSVQKREKWFLYPLAILLHFAIDAFAVLSTEYFSALITECFFLVMSVLTVLLARFIWKNNHEEERNHYETNTEKA